MARPVPADLEDALAATPAARERFWSLPPEHVDAWVRYVERARFPGARRRRVASAVRRLSGRGRAARATTVATNGNGAVVAPPRDDWFVLLLALLVLAGIVAVVLWLAVFRGHSHRHPTVVVAGAKSTVPHVVGIRVQAAKFQLKQAKLGARIVLHPSGKPRGIVVGQAPGAGKQLTQGTPVKLEVSTGPPGVKVPKLVGLAAADAVQRLQALKLGTTLTQTRSTAAPGTVVGQNPPAGKRAKPGSKVVLEVAKGKSAVTIPNVVGQPESSAVATLRRDGLTPHTVQVPSSQSKGTVVAQSPAAGQKLARGSTVRLNVSKGRPAARTTTATTTTVTTTQRTTTTTAAAPPPTKTSGPYGGMRLSQAAQKIAQGRQQVIVVYGPATQPVGTVISSSIAGSRIRLRVSAGPHPAPGTSVPDVTGEDQQTATSDLQSAGFKVVAVQWPVSDQSNDGMVVAETPNTSAPQGAQVVIYVGSATG